MMYFLYDTVDRKTPAPVDMVQISQHLRQVLYIQTVVFSPDFWLPSTLYQRGPGTKPPTFHEILVRDP